MQQKNTFIALECRKNLILVNSLSSFAYKLQTYNKFKTYLKEFLPRSELVTSKHSNDINVPSNINLVASSNANPNIKLDYFLTTYLCLSKGLVKVR